MDRSTGGLSRAGEWPVLRAMLPDLAGKRVLDLGCGFGWHCRYAAEMEARSVIGVDISVRVLERAREMTDDPRIAYVRSAIGDMEFPDGSFDLVLRARDGRRGTPATSFSRQSTPSSPLAPSRSGRRHPMAPGSTGRSTTTAPKASDARPGWGRMSSSITARSRPSSIGSSMPASPFAASRSPGRRRT